MARAVLDTNYNITEIHDDDVELTGAGYANFEIFDIPNVTKAEIKSIFNEKWPDRKFENGGRYWLNSEDLIWYKINNMPKYNHNLTGVSVGDLNKLKNPNTDKATKLAIIDTILTAFTLLPENNDEQEPPAKKKK
ncbi:MAG: hypothetical protein ACFFDY_01325 [Candidatus Thorarchaeota archaeon]